MKVNRFLIWFIIILTSLTVLISWPSVPVKFKIGEYQFDRTIKGPNLQDLLGKDVIKNFDIKLGLDLQGGTFISLRADMEGIAEADKTAKLEATRRVIENRVNQFGLSETNVYSSISGGDYKINVELPGSGSDVDNQIKVLQQTAKLDFYKEKDNPVPLDEIQNSGIDLTPESYLELNWDKTNISGADLISANSTSASGQGTVISSGSQYEVLLGFSPEGSKKFNEMATASRGKRIAIVLDGQIISAPTVSEDFGLTSGASDSVTINGLNQQESENLAVQIRGGALPIPVLLAEQKTIEATLGRDALNQSIVAGLVGIFLVICFMIFLYKKEGFIASIALIIYTLITISIYKAIPITLTLPGIAGFILSIGIAVDANVLIFERMNEEIRKGKSRTQALKLGFERAWTSIRDSNASTLITCLILFLFGSVMVKGFAINLAIGVLVSLFTAVTVTRQLLLATVLRSTTKEIKNDYDSKSKLWNTK